MRRLNPRGSERQPKGVQIPLGREERVAMMQQGLSALAYQAGLTVAQEFLQAEIEDLCGPVHGRLPGKVARRWGSQTGVVTMAGKKIRLRRPRARLLGGQEADLESYRLLQSPEAMPESALRLLMRGISCRDYNGALEQVAEGFGAQKSSVSRHFVRASAGQLKTMTERRFDDQRFVAAFIDGVHYGGETLVVALGVTEKGEKMVLGLRQGATENAALCKDLLTDLRSRGLSTETATLFVLDGSKALTAAVKAVFGELAVIQRCQQHKIRNVEAYLAEKYHEDIRGRMTAAYTCDDWQKARKMLVHVATWLGRFNQDAAASVREGLEETLTIMRLGLHPMLAKSFVTTNPIESAFSVAGNLTRRVKRWRDGNMRLRWATAGLLRAESKFNRLKGYKHIPQLLEALKAETEGSLLDEAASAA